MSHRRSGLHLTRRVWGRRHPLWMGMIWLVVIEAMVVASFITSWFYLRIYNPVWPPEGFDMPDLAMPFLRSTLLVVSAVVLLLWVRRPSPLSGPLLPMLSLTLIPVGLYLVLGIQELAGLPHDWRAHVYASLYWTLASYALVHAAVWIGLQGVLLYFFGLHFEPPATPIALEVTAIYAAFVAAAGLLTTITLNLGPYLVGAP